MFRIVLQKMIHNGWLVLCLAAGSILAVALISSIPMYTDAIMQRMLVRDLERFQVRRGRYPGIISARYNFYNPNEDPGRGQFYNYINETTTEDLIPRLGLPVLETSRHALLDYLLATDTEREDDRNRRPNLQINALQGFERHVDIVHGRMYDPEPRDGVFEVVASEQAMVNLDMLLGRTYRVSNMMSEAELFRVKVVGIYRPKPEPNLFWFRHVNQLSDSLIMDFEAFEQSFIYQYVPNLSYVYWFYALDYEQIKVEGLPGIVNVISRYQRLTSQYRIDFNFPILPIFEEYNERARTLSLMLLFLQTPVLLMLVFFIYMVSQLVINNERDEIAVLKSRGAGTDQVFNIYLTESVVLGTAALAAGPLLGFLIVSILGSSNGFMEFIQRVALPVRLSPRAMLYALAGFVLFVLTMMLPVVVFSRTTIVEHKRQKVRVRKSAFWKRFYLDLVLIALSMYGLYTYYSQQQILQITGVEGSALPVDPLLFGISVLFILGCGLLSLRLFPYFINLLFSLGKRVWKPEAYMAFVQVGRSSGVQQFLMIFLILSLSIGVFNSTAARTINRNVEDKIRYKTGADIAIVPYWEDLNAGQGGTADDPFAMPTAAISSTRRNSPQYIEPPFDPYLRIEGVETATKVFRKDRVSLRLPGGKATSAEFMAIIPHEFARTAWFREGLLPHSWYAYLSLLASSPRAVLVSRSVQQQYDLEQGDSILMTWAGQSSLEGIVYAFIDYWPAINPRAAGASGAGHQFVIGNYALVQAMMATEPYEIWGRKKLDATTHQIFSSIEDERLTIVKITDSDQEIIAEKNDPMLQGTNGVLTLGFLVSMAISIAGFVIYWVLTLKGRTLQFGIIRAMGMEKGRVTTMLVWEHLLISGTAIVLGILIGRLSSWLFVPLIQLVYASADQVPPFRIIVEARDFLQIYLIGLVMIGIGVALFRFIIARLNVHQALKLGEE